MKDPRFSTSGNSTVSATIIIASLALVAPFMDALGVAFSDSLTAHVVAEVPQRVDVVVGSQQQAGIASAATDFATLARRLQAEVTPARQAVEDAEQVVARARIAADKTSEAKREQLGKQLVSLRRELALVPSSGTENYGQIPTKLDPYNTNRSRFARATKLAQNGLEPNDALFEQEFGYRERRAFFLGLMGDLRDELGPERWKALRKMPDDYFVSKAHSNPTVDNPAIPGAHAFLAIVEAQPNSSFKQVRSRLKQGGHISEDGTETVFARRLLALKEFYSPKGLSPETRASLFSSDFDIEKNRALRESLEAKISNAQAQYDALQLGQAGRNVSQLAQEELANAELTLAAAQKRLTDAEAKVGEFDAFIAATRGYEADTRDALWTQVVAPFRSPDAMAALGMRAEQGFIFYGPPGTGKTYLAKKLSELLGGKGQFEIVKGSEFESKWVGESQQNLRKLFDDAARKAKDKPYVLVFDELDAALPESNGLGNEAYRSAVRGQFLSLMADALEKNPNLLVIGTTNRLSKIDPGLRRPGRFGAEIKIGNPSEQGRLDALEGMFGAANYDVDLAALAKSTAGYSFADLDALVNAAKQRAFGGSLFGKQLRVTEAHLKAARGDYLPTALRENSIAISPGVRFSDVGGLEDVIAELKRNIQFPILEGERLSALGQTPRIKSTLLYGPPGNGKTFVVNALANETQANVIAESASVIKSPEDVRELFERAKNAEPSIIVIDEIEAIVPRRGAGASYDDKIVNEFLAQMSGVSGSGKVAVIGMTNRRELIDPAVLRAGRLESQLFIGLPDQAARHAVLKSKTKRLKLARGSHAVDLDAVAAQTNGYSGADLDALVYEASFLAAERGAKTVSKSDFDSALAKVKPSVSKEDLATYTQDPERAFPVGFTANN